MNIKQTIYKYSIFPFLLGSMMACSANTPSMHGGDSTDGVRVPVLAAANTEVQLRSHDAGLSINKDTDKEDGVQKIEIFSNSSSDVAAPMVYNSTKWGADAPYVVFKKRFDAMPNGQKRDVILVANIPDKLGNQTGPFNIVKTYTAIKSGYLPISQVCAPGSFLMTAHLKNLEYGSTGLTASLVNNTDNTEEPINLSNGDPIILERAIACVDVVIKNDPNEEDARGIEIVRYNSKTSVYPGTQSFYIENYPNKVWYLPPTTPLDPKTDYYNYTHSSDHSAFQQIYYDTSNPAFLSPFLQSLSGIKDGHYSYDNLATDPSGLLIKPARIYIPENYPVDKDHECKIHILFQKDVVDSNNPNAKSKTEYKYASIPFGTPDENGLLHIKRNVHYTVVVTIVSWGKTGKIVLNVRVFRNKWEENEVTFPTFQ